MGAGGERQERGERQEPSPACVCCGAPVPDRPLGCRCPCPACGFLYPLGDCSD